MKNIFKVSLIMLTAVVLFVGTAVAGEKEDFIAAVEAGDIKSVKRLIKNGFDVNMQMDKGTTPLITATKNGNQKIVKFLVKEGAHVGTKDDNGITALMMAAKKGNIILVKFLAEEEADIDALRKKDPNILIFAAQAPLSEVTEYFIDKGIDVNAKNGAGKTALYLAAQNGVLDTMKLLIEKKADVNVVASNGGTILHSAAYGGNLEIVKFLIDKGLEINVKDKTGETLLHWAAEGGNIDTVKYLLELGLEFKAVNDNGSSVLLYAVKSGNIDTVKFIIKKGADVNAKKNNGWTALMLAAKGGHVEVAGLLIEKGADVNAKSNKGWTALMLAAKGGYVEVAGLLIDKGAYVKTKDVNRQTALLRAIKNGHTDLVKLLINKGADINATQRAQWSALMIAAYEQHSDIVAELIKAGVDLDNKDLSGRTALSLATKYDWKSKKMIIDASSTPLMAASRVGDVEMAADLIKNASYVNARDGKYGWSALMLAVWYGNTGVAELLIEKGAGLDLKKKNGMTALMIASKEGKLDIMKLLIDGGADVNFMNSNEETALLFATNAGFRAAGMILKTAGALEVSELQRNMGDGGKDQDSDVLSGNKGMTPLTIAAKENRVDEVKRLIQEGVDINDADDDGWTALTLALKYSNTEIAEFLIENGADVNVEDKDGWTALMLASKAGNVEIAKLLIKKGADVNVKNNHGETILTYATMKDHIAVVELLIENGADVNMRNNKGDTPLRVAAWYGYVELSDLLIRKGALVNAKDKNGNTPLSGAAYEGFYKVAEFLLRKGAVVDMSDDGSQTPLYWAALQGHVAVTEVLIENGADVEARNALDVTPLHMAARGGWTELAEILISKGADIEAENREKVRPLHYAAWFGHVEVAELLISKGADIEARDEGNSAPLYFAVTFGKIESVKALLGWGAKMNVRDTSLSSPIIIAANKGFVYIVQVLIDNGATFDFDRSGYFEYLNIAEKKLLNIVKVLGELGEESTLYTFLKNTGQTEVFTTIRKNYLYGNNIKILTKSKDKELKAYGHYMEALKAREEGRYKDQLGHTERALKYVSTKKQRGLNILTLWLKSQAYIKLGQNKEALESIGKAEKLLQKINVEQMVAHEEYFKTYTLYLKGDVLTELGESGKAIESYTEALKMLDEEKKIVVDSIDEEEALRLNNFINGALGRAHISRGQELVSKSVEEGRKYAARDTVELESKIKTIIAHAKQRISEYENEEAQKLIEEAVLLRTQFVMRNVNIRLADSEKQKQLDSHRGLVDEIAELHRNITLAKSEGDGDGQEGESVSELKTKLNQKKKEMRKFINVLKKNHPDIAALLGAKPIELATIQEKLPADAAFLQYLVLSNKLIAFIIRNDDIEIIETDIEEHNLRELVAEHYELITLLSYKKVGKKVLREIDELSRQLGSVLFKPIISSGNLAGVKTLGIAPNSFLHKLAFSSIIVKSKGDKGKAVHLIDAYDLFYVNSTSMLGVAMDRAGPSEKEQITDSSLFAFSNPDGTLKFSELELSKISKHFTNKTVYSEDAATKSVIENRTGTNEILHLSTHGKFNSSDSTKSKIITADGFLTIEDIWGLPLNGVRITILSACETGLGELLSGDDVVSLENAFIYAGSPAVVSTLWEVDELSTAEIMGMFYDNLMGGMTKAEALTTAQKDLRKDPQYSNPYYWAGFTMRGDWR